MWVWLIEEGAGGSRGHPAWWMNLRADPNASIRVGSRKLSVKAQEADGSQRERLWQLVNEVWSDYEQYQEKTERRIPVVVLKPNG